MGIVLHKSSSVGFTKFCQAKYVPYYIYMMLKNAWRLCYECGCDLPDNVGRTSPLCSRCSQDLTLIGYIGSHFPLLGPMDILEDVYWKQN